MNYDYLLTGETSAVRENGATSGVGVLAAFAYDDLGNRTSVTYGNGAVQAFGHDPVSRLSSLTNDLSGTTNDLTVSSIAYNPAGQIVSLNRSNDAYAFSIASGTTATVANGLNQQITIGGASATWDTKGNLTSDPTSAKTYGYSSENLLTSASGGATLGYDPALRLYQVAGAATTRFLYDGADAIAEYNSTDALQRRFVFADGQPIVQYEGTGTSSRYFTSADERGSIVSFTDSAGALIALNRYDEYGKPQSTNIGRFQYTGQMWLPELGAYYYKARVYLPHLGVFAQTDPAGYDPSPHLYAYVHGDPVNASDPSGMDPTAPVPMPMGSNSNPCLAGYVLTESGCIPTSAVLSAPSTISGVRGLGNPAQPVWTPPISTAILPGYQPPSVWETIGNIMGDVISRSGDIIPSVESAGADLPQDILTVGDVIKTGIDIWGVGNTTPEWVYNVANVSTSNDWAMVPGSVYADYNSDGYITNFDLGVNQFYQPGLEGTPCTCQVDTYGPNGAVEIEFK